jgi:hypothetical protein
LSQGPGKQEEMQDNEIGNNDGRGLEETCDGVKQGCNHGGEDGWGCCGGTRDGLEEGGKRGSDCSTTPSLRSFAIT